VPSKALGARQNSTVERRSGAPVPLPHVRAAQSDVAEARLLQRLAAGTGRVRPAEILSLQRAAGNHAVAQVLRRAPYAPMRMSISRFGSVRRRVQRYELLDKGLDNWRSGTSEGLFGWGGRSGYKAVDAAFTTWDSVKNGKDAKVKIAALDVLSNRIKQWQGAKGWATSGKKAAKLLQEVEEERPKQEAQAKVQAATAKILSTHKFQVAAKQWTLGELNGIDAGLATFKT